MKFNNFKEIRTPKTLTVRNVDQHRDSLLKAMSHYNTSVATTVIFKAIKDIPEISAKIKDLQQENYQLQQELQSVKNTIKDYFRKEKILIDLSNK